MARKRRSAPYTQAPPQVPRGRVTAAGTKATAGAAPAQADTPQYSTPAALATQYAFVRRDLMRIVVLGAAMFVLIYASTLVLK